MAWEHLPIDYNSDVSVVSRRQHSLQPDGKCVNKLQLCLHTTARYCLAEQTGSRVIFLLKIHRRSGINLEKKTHVSLLCLNVDLHYLQTT